MAKSAVRKRRRNPRRRSPGTGAGPAHGGTGSHPPNPGGTADPGPTITDDNPVTSQNMDGGCYTREQIGAAMIITGWPEEPQVIADGIATSTAESGRCRVANHSPSCGGPKGCWGPWQLNPDNGGNSAIERCAAELICSTQTAKSLYDEGGWGKWQAYTRGSTSDVALARKLLAMEPAQLRTIVGAAANLNTPFEDALNGAKDAITAPFDALKAIVAFLSRLFEPSFWLRVGKVIIGAVALIIGTSILARAMLGVDLGVGERFARAAAYTRAAPDPGPGPTPSERRKGRREIDRVLEDNPGVAKSQRPLDEPPF